MARPFKFKYVHRLAGIFVFFAIWLFLMTFFMAGYFQGWFEKKVKYHTIFSTKEGTFGLQKGADVRVLNTVAGFVQSIDPNEDGYIEAAFNVKKVFEKYIRMDSIAVVKKQFGLAGDAYLEIIPGDVKKPRLPEGTYIKSVKDTEIMETVTEVLEDLRKAFLPAIGKLETSLTQLPSLMTQMQNTFSETELLIRDLRSTLKPVIKDFNHLISQSENMVLKLDNTIKNFDTLLNELNDEIPGTFDKLDKVLSDLTTMIQSIKQFIDEIEKEELNEFMNTLPEIGTRLHETLYEAEKVMEGVQKHWLLRKYVNQEVNLTKGLVPYEVDFKEKDS